MLSIYFLLFFFYADRENSILNNNYNGKNGYEYVVLGGGGGEGVAAVKRTELTHKSYVVQNDILFPACLPAESEPIFRFILYTFPTTTATARGILYRSIFHRKRTAFSTFFLPVRRINRWLFFFFKGM